MIALKKLLLVALIFVVLAGGFFIYLKSAPPLTTGDIEIGENHDSVVIELGNKGFRDLKVDSVQINNHAVPKDAKIQVGKSLKDFAAAVDEDPEAGEDAELKEIDEVSIPKGTNPGESSTKYSLKVSHDEDIHNVHIRYRYFGILFSETVVLN
jgi:hypothetical protein